MLMRTLLWAFFFASGYCATTNEDDIFPLNLQFCKRSDSNYSTCFKNAINKSWPTLVRGVPQFGSPPLDPLEIGNIDKYVRIGQLNVNMILRDVKVYGLANTKFSMARPTFTDDRVKLDLHAEIPKILLDGDYKAAGTYAVFIRVRGAGYFNISMERVTTKWSLEGPVENDRWIIEQSQNDPEIKGMKLYFSDLFNGNHMLNNAAMSMMNRGWPTFFRNLKPTVTDVFNTYVVNILNRDIFSKVSASKIFPS